MGIVLSNAISAASPLYLSSGQADKIEKEMQYPGEIKIIVIRETHVIEYAR